MQIYTFQAIFLFLLLLLMLIVLGIGFYIIKHFGSPFPKLFHEFDKKIWMTLGLGITFFGFYFLVIMLLSWSLSNENSTKIFSFLRQYLREFIYLGLSMFACTTLAIYLVRLVIKRLYNKRY